MPTTNAKKNRIWIAGAVALAAIAFFGYRHWQAQKTAVPEGIAWGNGRIEAKLVDATAKEALRVKDILVDEGDLVKPGQVLVHLDTTTIESELANAKARLAATREQLAVAQASIAKQKAQITLAQIEADRAHKLVQANAGSQRDYDVRRTTVETTRAGLAEQEAKLDAAKQDVQAAEASVATIQTRIDDATLVSPIQGRVLYRLAEPGEVLGAGGKALTLVNLQDVYMEIFLPSEQASAVKVGAEGRITVDSQPNRSAPGVVTFVSPEAQFTPKQVETRSERDKLMFRVKVQVPQELVTRYIQAIKTGMRGVAYVKLDPAAQWPDWLQRGLIQTS